MGKLSKSELVKKLALKSFKECDLDNDGEHDSHICRAMRWLRLRCTALFPPTRSDRRPSATAAPPARHMLQLGIGCMHGTAPGSGLAGLQGPLAAAAVGAMRASLYCLIGIVRRFHRREGAARGAAACVRQAEQGGWAAAAS